jgi:hypothetical protein
MHRADIRSTVGKYDMGEANKLADGVRNTVQAGLDLERSQCDASQWLVVIVVGAFTVVNECNWILLLLVVVACLHDKVRNWQPSMIFLRSTPGLLVPPLELGG